MLSTQASSTSTITSTQASNSSRSTSTKNYMSGCCLEAEQPGIVPATSESQVQHPKHCATRPHDGLLHDSQFLPMSVCQCDLKVTPGRAFRQNCSNFTVKQAKQALA